MTRKEARALRAGLSSEAQAAHSAQITAHVLGWEVYLGAETVMAYASVGSEVNTWPLLEEIIKAGKRLLLPRCYPNGIMRAMEVPRLSLLVPGTLGIPEPPLGAKVADKRMIDLILAPGLLFDSKGNRLGQGAGYYDRFLSDYHGISCGVAFSAQVMDSLETQPHDVPVDALVTEHRLYTTGRNGHG